MSVLDKLNAFVSLTAQRVYGLRPKKKTILLEKKDFIVPSSYTYKNENVVPMYADETLAWSIKKN